ncbi:uncharacterized protein BP01DRAFT_408481 [Aspergillus saccharolyticus JOP 1030-1]|uniref:Uncharacterized protein n=1 Tax=Aspergillus saccharolyticus JOP 1030-1 TaxID=1450539 RepID=A0A318Z226_9EURO|nr:hypothetical protein BP01DRAFT_408481 [Aspergillus saccharolyticus JOP 1030-1]PYH40979.1 hypothetical protein BP01DRAFT_408481 [Aspergillus saccharolyticus JOP 1030-1]
MLTNVVATYGLYLPVIFFYQVVWFGLSSVIFGFALVWIHGIMINMKLGSNYNPELTALVPTIVLIGLKYMQYMQERGVITPRDWVLGSLVQFCLVTVSSKAHLAGSLITIPCILSLRPRCRDGVPGLQD